MRHAVWRRSTAFLWSWNRPGAKHTRSFWPADVQNRKRRSKNVERRL